MLRPATVGVERGTLPRAVLNLLYSGGSMSAGSKAPSSEATYGLRIRALYPSLALLGGAVDGFILPRGLVKLAAWPVAREYQDVIASAAPHLAEAAAATSAYDLLSDETRVRGTGDESAGNQMIYTYEVLAAGAQVLIELTFDPHASDIHHSAIATALAQWDGYIGGQGRQGRGRMRIVSVDGLAADASLYGEHLHLHRDQIRVGLVGGTLGCDRPVAFAS